MRKMVRIIAVYHRKGGVAKTTTTGNLAAWLAELRTNISNQNKKILVIDTDDSANLSYWLLKHEPEMTVRDLLQGCPVKKVIYESVIPGVDIIPSCFGLAAIEPFLNSEVSCESILKSAIEPIKDNYDIIIIDSNPGVTVLPKNVLNASRDVIIPVDAAFAVSALDQIISLFLLVKNRLNPQLKIRGVLITKDKSGTKLSNGLRDKISAKYDIPVFDTVIPDNVDLVYCIDEHKSIIDYAPKSNGAIAYKAFTEELMNKWGMV